MPPRPRLLVVSHGFPPYYGGAEHAAGQLARVAAASGRWEVQVLTSDIGGRLPAAESQSGVEIVRVPVRKRHWARHTVLELISFLIAARRYVPRTRPDWVLGNCTLPGGAVARRIALQYSAPYAVVLQGSDVPGYQNSRFGLAYQLTKPWVRRIWQDAARVIAVGEPLRDLALLTWPEGRIEVIPNGVDVDRFRPSESPQPKGAGASLLIMVVAQLIERKGLHHLIAALAQLPDSLQGRLRLSLCGTGPCKDALHRQAKEAGLAQQVEFAGLVPYDQVPARLQQADLFVLPSLQEGLPLSLLEAMACGLPVIATKVGGIPELVRDGTNGLLVPAGHVGALAEALTRLLADSLERQRMAKAARQEALSWSWQAVWAQYESLFVSGMPA